MAASRRQHHQSLLLNILGAGGFVGAAVLSYYSAEPGRVSMLGWLLVSVGLVCFVQSVRIMPVADRGRSGCASAVLAFFTWAGIIIVLPILMAARGVSAPTRCLGNIKLLGNAVLMYAADHDGFLPVVGNWQTQTNAYLGGAGDGCPNAKTQYGYGMNAAYAGIEYSPADGSDQAVLLFEMDSNRPNAVGGVSDVAFRHSGRASVFLVSGNAEWAGKAGIAKLRWTPAPQLAKP